MTSTTQATAFVQQLPKLHRAHPALMAAAAVGDEPPAGTASVAGNALVAFTADLDQTHQTELLYAVGYAQLQASNPDGFNIDPRTDPIAYYNKVVDILTGIGFVMQSFDFAAYNAKARTVELDTVVLQIMAEILTAPELALVDAALDALKSSAGAGSAPWTIYSSNSESNNAGGYSVGTASQSTAPDGSAAVALKLSAYTFSGTETHTDFLWMSYDATDIHLQTGQSQLVINDDLWNHPGVGDAISEQMKAMSAGYIANLPPLHPKKP